MDDFAVVKTYATRIEAEIGKTKLTSRKIPSFIHADDAGGMRPFPFSPTLTGIRLMVNKQDYKKASEVLDIQGTDVNTTHRNTTLIHSQSLMFLIIAFVLVLFIFTIHKLQIVNNSFDNKPQPKVVVSVRPRDKIIVYEVTQNDTVTGLAKRFNISEDTIKWANNLTNNSLQVGLKLSILPVIGVAHKVQKNETIQTIATMYHTIPEKIASYPFNDFEDLETFGITPGQMIIVPDGVISPTQ